MNGGTSPVSGASADSVQGAGRGDQEESSFLIPSREIVDTEGEEGVFSHRKRELSESVCSQAAEGSALDRLSEIPGSILRGFATAIGGLLVLAGGVSSAVFKGLTRVPVDKIMKIAMNSAEKKINVIDEDELKQREIKAKYQVSGYVATGILTLTGLPIADHALSAVGKVGVWLLRKGGHVSDTTLDKVEGYFATAFDRCHAIYKHRSEVALEVKEEKERKEKEKEKLPPVQQQAQPPPLDDIMDPASSDPQ